MKVERIHIKSRDDIEVITDFRDGYQYVKDCPRPDDCSAYFGGFVCLDHGNTYFCKRCKRLYLIDREERDREYSALSSHDLDEIVRFKEDISK